MKTCTIDKILLLCRTWLRKRKNLAIRLVQSHLFPITKVQSQSKDWALKMVLTNMFKTCSLLRPFLFVCIQMQMQPQFENQQLSRSFWQHPLSPFFGKHQSARCHVLWGHHQPVWAAPPCSAYTHICSGNPPQGNRSLASILPVPNLSHCAGSEEHRAGISSPCAEGKRLLRSAHQQAAPELRNGKDLFSNGLRNPKVCFYFRN